MRERHDCFGGGTGWLRQVQVAARQGARDADRQRSAETGFGQPGAVAAAICDNVTLLPSAEVKLPIAPERAPKSNNTFAGFIEASAPAQKGTYKITLSSEGWIDIVQNGERLKSIAATGATGCDGIRKSVKFELAKTPFTVQFSGVEANSIGVAISRE
jgi:hypothetical protein